MKSCKANKMSDFHFLQALKRATAEAEHVHEVGLEEYENDSLFYIAYGQLMCVVQTSQRADVENTTRSSLGNKQLWVLKQIFISLRPTVPNCIVFQC